MISRTLYLSRAALLGLTCLVAGCGGNSNTTVNDTPSDDTPPSRPPATSATDNTFGHDVANGIALDPISGNVIVAGTSSGSLGDENAGNTDAILLSYSDLGDLNWSLQWGMDTSDSNLDVTVDMQSTIYVAGRSSTDATTSTGWIRRYDANGNQIGEEMEIAGGLQGALAYYPHGIAASTMSTVVYVSGYVHQSDGDTDAWLAAYDESLQQLWFVEIATPEDDFAFAVTADESGSVYAAGYTFGDLGGTNAGHRDAWVAKYDSAGQQQWVQQLGSTSADVAADVAADGDSVYLTGYTAGSLAADSAGGQDVWVAAYSSDGVFQWSEQFGSTADDYAFAVDRDADEVTLIGHTDGDLGDIAKGGGQHDAWTAKLDLDGTVTRVIQFGSPHDEQVRSGFTDSEGSIFLAGDTEGSLGSSIPSSASVWVGKLSSSGKPVWIDRIGATEPEVGGVGQYTAERVGDLTRFIVPPTDTDPAIINWIDDHYIYVDEGQSIRDMLVLYLPGSYGIPAHAQLYPQLVAARGFPIISLRYPNEWTVGDLCNGSDVPADSEDDCFGQIRTEIITGQDMTELVEVSPTDSITNRLVKVLQFMQQQEPQIGWDKWLNGDEVRWESIIVSGHSQGGGHSAFISKMHEVARVVMFASPEDTYADGTPAPWLSAPGVTPANRYFGFDHINDPSWVKNQVNWGLLGMPAYGDVVEIGTHSPPYGNTHQLLTDVPPSTGVDHGTDTHGSVVVDSKTPLVPDGDALYGTDDVWGYLCCPMPE